ncbi:uncharacterized protein LOC104582497 [Brachypodium distachyon]|uniref:Uncharacterized protein n=1 Tax=Brachypodium distachyon TaxID=15368 RepID=I1HCC3_BRADI|nr:uncharacterized protein LOC104582497 [Brachypodium distachyon]KQK02857.1 hypothetical protein BRADI_2g04140v3 [Brachypodium distachyon]|eukprot:XP_010230493.1 uncharacterized protein LOC104582497 [Brachypodium distachyon]
MASPRPATWSVSACLRYRGGLEIRAAAENVVLPWWGHGGERLSFLLRLRRRLRLAVTSQCARAPAPASADPESKEKKKKPRALKLLRFLRSRLARAPSALRRKKPPPPRAEDEDDRGDPRAQPVPCFLTRALMRPAKTKTTATVLCFVAALAVAVVALRLVAGFVIPPPTVSCTSWRCFLAKKLAKKLLGPPLQEWFSRIGLRILEFLDPPAALRDWPGLPKLGLKWLFNM